MSRNLRYPSIVGKTPTEQVGEIRRYLFTLVDDLNYLFGIGSGGQVSSNDALPVSDLETRQALSQFRTTLDEAKASMGEAKASVEDIKTSLEKVKDYVSDTGTSGNWNYKKWNSGLYELFGTFPLTCGEATAAGSMFITQTFSLSLPFAISDAVISGSASDNFFVVNAKKSSVMSDAVIFSLLRPTTFTTGNSVTVRLYITGKYI